MNTMSETKKKRIKKLAARRGTPLLYINQWGKAISFVYKEGMKTIGYSYSTIDKGFRGEIKRLG